MKKRELVAWLIIAGLLLFIFVYCRGNNFDIKAPFIDLGGDAKSMLTFAGREKDVAEIMNLADLDSSKIACWAEKNNWVIHEYHSYLRVNQVVLRKK